MKVKIQRQGISFQGIIHSVQLDHLAMAMVLRLHALGLFEVNLDSRITTPFYDHRLGGKIVPWQKTALAFVEIFI